MKIATLEVDSDNAEILDAVKKVKLQAEHLRHKAGKMDVTHFAKNAEKFALLAEVIDNENFLPSDYIKVVNAFQDNPLISMVLTQKILHFPRPVEVEEVAVEEEEEKISAPTKSEFESSELPNKHRIAAVMKKFDKVKPDLVLMEADEKDFSVEKAQVKKQLTIKSFNKKLHELIESIEPMMLFKLLIRNRIFFIPQPKAIDVTRKFSKKLGVMTPTILDRLFSWGLADKVTWRDHNFYFLNEQGMELCVRAFTHSTFQPEKNSFSAMKIAIKFYMVHVVKAKMKELYEGLEFVHHSILPASRGKMKINDSDEIQVVWLISLTLLGSKWSYILAKFKMLLEEDVDSDCELKAVILFGFTKEDVTWLKIFDTIKFKQIKFFMYTLDGLFTQDEKEIPFSDWGKLCKFGVPSRKRKKNLPQLPEPPETPEPPAPTPPPKPPRNVIPHLPNKNFKPISSEDAVRMIFNEAKKNVPMLKKITDDFIFGRAKIDGKPANQVLSKLEILEHVKKKYGLDLFDEYKVERPSEVIDDDEPETVEENI